MEEKVVLLCLLVAIICALAEMSPAQKRQPEMSPAPQRRQ
jgi:hypothetical protein